MRRFGGLFAALLMMTVTLCGCGSSKLSSVEEQGSVQNEQRQPLEEMQDTEQTTDQTPITYVQPEMKGEITISCLYQEEFLSVAADQFMNTYPDVKITINSYQGSSGPGAVENYLTYLNTKIMTGEAEDILFTSFLPVTKYSKMGVFEDLSSYISAMPEINDENYFMNVLQAAKEDDGAIYLIPYVTKFNTVGFSSDLLSGHTESENELGVMQTIRFSKAIDIAKRLVDDTDKNNAFLTQMNEVSLMDYLVKDNLGQFIDVDKGQVNFNTPEYMELLKSVKAFAENGYFDSDLDFYNIEYYFAATIDYDVQAAFYSLDKNSSFVYCMPIADSDGRVSISANACVALNSASGNKDLAWEFIRYLLSEEIQTLPSVHGAAVNRQGFEAAVERYYNFYCDGNKSAFVEKDAYHDVLETWLNQVNDCDTLDPDIMWMIEEENNKYFTNQQPAEVTAQNLQRQLEQYFNE